MADVYFLDGFDHYAAIDLTRKWNSSADGGQTASIEIDTTTFRTDRGALRLAGSANVTARARFEVAGAVPLDACYVGFAFKANIAPTATRTFVRTAGRDNPMANAELRALTDGRLQVWNTVLTGSEVNSSMLTLYDNQWHYVEFFCQYNSSDNFMVKFDGVTVIAGAATDLPSVPTDGTHVTVYNITRASPDPPNPIYFTWYDDLYIAGEFLDPIEIRTLHASADGTATDWTGNNNPGEDDWEHVDDVTPDGDSTRLTPASDGQDQEHEHEDLSLTPSDTPIVAVQRCFTVKQGAALNNLQFLKRDSGGQTQEETVDLTDAADDFDANFADYACLLKTEDASFLSPAEAATLNGFEFGLEANT